MKVVHLSDLHLPEPGQRLWGLDAYGRTEQALQDICRWHADADLCVISGDLADRGAKGAYRWLERQVAHLPFETVLMVGNHDDRSAMRETLPNLMDDGNGFVQGIRRTPHGMLVFLDTFKDGTSPGQYCDVRLAWLRRALAEADGPIRIFMHHPPCDIGIPYMDRIKLEEAEAFAEALRGYEIAHLFFGHVHRACFLTWEGIPCNALPGINHQVPLTRESVATRYSVEPPMYGLIWLDGAQTTVHLDAFMDRTPADMPE